MYKMVYKINIALRAHSYSSENVVFVHLLKIHVGHLLEGF